MDCGLACRAALATQKKLVQKVRQPASDAHSKYEVPSISLANRGAGVVTITYCSTLYEARTTHLCYQGIYLCANT